MIKRGEILVYVCGMEKNYSGEGYFSPMGSHFVQTGRGSHEEIPQQALLLLAIKWDNAQRG